MSETTVTLITWAVGGILTLLFFFVSFYFYRSVSMLDRLSDSVNGLRNSITELNSNVDSIKSNSETFADSCRGKHEVVDKRLNDHSRRLNEHDIKLAHLETSAE
jgi:hypothetical protein